MMDELVITGIMISEFKNHLRLEEKSSNTIEKYTRDVEAFAAHINSAAVTKEVVIAYKEKLISDGYSIRSINSVIASLNSFFSFAGRFNLKIKTIKEQRQLFCSEDKELTKDEYNRLINAAKNKG